MNRSFVKVLWTTNKFPLSRLICAVTREPVSHVALCHGGYVLHATITGVQIVPEAAFRASNRVVFEVGRYLTDGWFRKQRDKYAGRPYDTGAMLFLGASLLLRRYLRLPLPKSNLWQSSGMFLCTEWASLVVEAKSDPLVTPYGLYKRLKHT